MDGNALLSALRDEGAKLRGAACGEPCTAGWPAGLSAETSSPRARAGLAVSRYALGVAG
jgi:hypothetical protein